MSTTNEISQNDVVTGDGAVTIIPFQFNWNDRDNNIDILVTTLDTATDTITTLVEDTDYSIVIEDILLGISSPSIVLTDPLPVGTNLLIQRVIVNLQSLDYQSNRPFPATTHERLVDRVYMSLSELKNLFKKVPKLGLFSDPNINVELPDPEEGQYLAWDGTTGRLRNASTTIDPLLLQASDLIYDNTVSALSATNVQDAIDETKTLIDSNSLSIVDVQGDITDLDTRLDTAESEIDTLQSDLNTVESDLTALTDVVNFLFPVGKMDFTLKNSVPPNNLDWISLNTDRTLSRTGTYEDLYDWLDANSLIVDEGSIDWEDFFAYRPTADPTSFVIRSFNALSPRGTGSNTINGNTKTGPIEGTFQEDQMQRITGSITNLNGPRGETSAGVGALSDTAYANSSAVGGTARGVASVGFDSGDSPSARVSSTTDGETRISSFPVTWWIRY